MSALLDIAIGLVLTFLLFSIVVSGLNEWFAQAFARRGDFLRLGMQRLINDEAVYRRVLHHPLIGSLYRERAAKGKPPSYVEPANFALAVADVLLARAKPDSDSDGGSRPLSIDALRDALRAPALANSPVSTALGPIFERANGNFDQALKGIEAWFGSSMERVGGWYKARTQKMLFLIGLVVAVACNVDTLQIFTALNRSPALRAAFVGAADSAVKTAKIGDVNLAELERREPTPAEWASLRPVFESLRATDGEALPIGYACLGLVFQAAAPKPDAAGPLRACQAELKASFDGRSFAAWFLKLVGWTLTALAGTLGAAYWFELLSKGINLRGSGTPPKPAEPARGTQEGAGR